LLLIFNYTPPASLADHLVSLIAWASSHNPKDFYSRITSLFPLPPETIFKFCGHRNYSDPKFTLLTDKVSCVAALAARGADHEYHLSTRDYHASILRGEPV
jgi:hypothetical protein